MDEEGRHEVHHLPYVNASKPRESVKREHVRGLLALPYADMDEFLTGVLDRDCVPVEYARVNGFDLAEISLAPSAYWKALHQCLDTYSQKKTWSFWQSSLARDIFKAGLKVEDLQRCIKTTSMVN